MNSGDWIESNTALVEHLDGRFEIIPFDDFCERIEKLRTFNCPEPDLQTSAHTVLTSAV